MSERGNGDLAAPASGAAGADGSVETVIETEVPPLELVGIRAAYGGIEVLHGIDLAVAGGEVVALLGANGAGKSTTVKVAAGVLRPTAGAVRVVVVVGSGSSPAAAAPGGRAGSGARPSAPPRRGPGVGPARRVAPR